MIEWSPSGRIRGAVTAERKPLLDIETRGGLPENSFTKSGYAQVCVGMTAQTDAERIHKEAVTDFCPAHATVQLGSNREHRQGRILQTMHC